VAGGDHGVRRALAGRGLEVVAAELLGEPPLGDLVARRGVPRVLPQGAADDGERPGQNRDTQHDTGDEHPAPPPLDRRRPGCWAASARRKPTTG